MIRSLLTDARAVLGHRCLMGELAVVPVAVLVWILAMGFAPGLAGPEGPEPHSRLGASHGIPIAEAARD